MDWRHRHTALVVGWAGVALLDQLGRGGAESPAALAGTIVGAVLGAALVVYLLGSGWQWVVRRVRS